MRAPPLFIHTRIYTHRLPAEFITPANATVDALTPIINDLKGVLNTAVADVNALVGAPAATLLAGVDGAAQVTVQELAQLVADLLNAVFGALGAVLNVAGGAVGAILPLLSSVGCVAVTFLLSG